jgi:hypothetical protein
MLLLKKKKYAALTVSETPEGGLSYAKELKGLDLVCMYVCTYLRTYMKCFGWERGRGAGVCDGMTDETRLTDPPNSSPTPNPATRLSRVPLVV